MLVHDFIEFNATVHPDKTALICGLKRFSYKQLDEMANRLANAFQVNSVKRGDRVVIYLNNSVEAVVSIFAVLKAGAIFVVINRNIKLKKLEFILNDCEATALVIDHRSFMQGIGELLLNSVKSLKKIVVCDNTGSGPRNDPLDYNTIQSTFTAEKPPFKSIDIACLIYTSGTTGEPKGVICNHSNLIFINDAIIHYLNNSDQDIVLSVLPLAFSYGLYQLMAMFRVGGTLVLEESFAFPSIVLKKIAENHVTGFAGVPTIYAIMLECNLNGLDFTSLRYLTNAAAGLPVDHVRRLRQLFPNVDLYLMHGLTEVARTMYLPPDQVELRPGSSGIPIEGTKLWIEDEKGHPVGPGAIGELIVQGPHVMAGYWNDPELTAERFQSDPISGERICRTGDLFKTDKEGYYFFVSRKDDMIKSRGEKISPQEIENSIYAIHGVQEAAVIGVSDPVMGHVIKAFIVAPATNLTEADIISHCKSHLEDFMLPRQVEFRNSLPKTPSGKIRKIELL